MKQPSPAADMLVRYSANEMPTPVIERLRKQTSTQIIAGDVKPLDAYRITDLLLGIALLKLQASP